jgi:hypothetical protein
MRLALAWFGSWRSFRAFRSFPLVSLVGFACLVRAGGRIRIAHLIGAVGLMGLCHLIGDGGSLASLTPFAWLG